MTVGDWECRINYLKIDLMFILNLLATNQLTNQPTNQPTNNNQPTIK